jgi:lathosterol oxidase
MTDLKLDIALAAWPAIWLGDWLRYLLPAALLSALLALLPLGWRQARTVQARPAVPGQRRREFWNSMVTVLVFSLNGTVIFTASQAGKLCLYTDIGRFGVPYLFLSGLVLVLAHDTWFYWTHRLMHRPRLFRWVHRTHHRSVSPTPWAAYSFAVSEAAVQAIFLPLILLVLPLHPLVIFVFLVYMIVRNVMGHAGVELIPRRWLAGWWGQVFTTTLHHDMHHAHGRFNYGLYFTWWDRLCRTEHPQYRERLRMLAAGPEPSASALTPILRQRKP